MIDVVNHFQKVYLSASVDGPIQVKNRLELTPTLRWAVVDNQHLEVFINVQCASEIHVFVENRHLKIEVQYETSY